MQIEFVDEQTDALEGQPVTEDDAYFLEVWRRSFELSLARATESVNRMLTLSTALTGGSLVLLKEDICYGWWKIIAAVFFFISLGIASHGTAPLELSGIKNPDIVRDNLEAAAKYKAGHARYAGWAMLAGIGAAIIGTIARHATK